MRSTFVTSHSRLASLAIVVALGLPGSPARTVVAADAFPIDTRRGDRLLADYFRRETQQLSDACLADVRTLDDWLARREQYRRQLLEMLGLDPWPERTELAATVTGRVEHDEFTVEKVHFQSRPGLYVTGNLYVPKPRGTGLQPVDRAKLPAVLYVCGHSVVKKGETSYGAKAGYQHHGAWLARNGYVCLTIDTLQLGEIEGIHHGTYRYNMWWWLNRGYTPAGVEAWNCVRALDYLETRPEVDAKRIGVTGRSGGGAYSWWIAAIDDRIRCAVPVAGITDLTNHVVDGTVEGHCDCMFMVNTYRWDYPLVAALVAPRPLLLSNTDSDGIFPLDGVYRTFLKTREIYRLHGADDKVALNITAGGHKDTQELQVHALRWLNHHLKQDDGLIENPAVKFFEPEQLRVFDSLPTDQRNTEIHETYVPMASPSPPRDAAEWKRSRQGWRDALDTKSFAGWPREPEPLAPRVVLTTEHDGIQLQAIDFDSQQSLPLRLYVAQRAGLARPDLIVLNTLDESGWREFLATYRVGFAAALRDETLPEEARKEFESTKTLLTNNSWAMAYVAPRGIGPTAWDQSEKKQTQHRRRFYLLGQSLDGMRVYDVRRAIQALRSQEPWRNVPLWLQGERAMGAVALYASLYEPDIQRIDLHELPASHRDGPYFLNVNRYLDLPQAVAMAAERSQVVIYAEDRSPWQFACDTSERLGWSERQLQFRP